MLTASLHEKTNAVFTVEGALTFTTVAHLLKAAKHTFPTQADFTVDFSAVTQSDSAGVALMLAWRRFAKKHQQSVHFTHVSSKMQSIIKVCGLQQILKVED